MSDKTAAPAADQPAVAPGRRAEILDGLRITLPFMVGAAPFGVIFGALATAQHLSAIETMAMSLFVFSGSAQIVAISLLAVATPAWVIWAVTLILNVRHLLYAASLVGYVRHLALSWRFILSAGLTDETFAAMEDRYRRLGVHRNSHWAFLSSIVGMHLNWNCWTLAGIAIGTQIKGLEGSGLEFAVIATFIGMVVRRLRTPGALTAAAAAGMMAVLLAALPYKAGLTIATLVAIAAAVLVDRRAAIQRIRGNAA
ncbi:MAG TPA: AzlC family ABC transporter permease [Dongiaceae bacterium]